MKIEGRSWMWIIILGLLIAGGLFLSWRIGASSNVTKLVDKQLKEEKVALQKDYNSRLKALEFDRDKYRADYIRLANLLAKKVQQRSDIKPPKDAVELAERSKALGYPVKEIR